MSPEFNIDVNIVEERRNLLNLVKRCDAILNRLSKEGIIAQLISRGSEVKPTSEEQEAVPRDPRRTEEAQLKHAELMLSG